MNSETKTCQNCKAQFTIVPEDFAFYDKLKVPPPTWCPQCRLQRRLTQINVRVLYKRTCDLCKKETLSLFQGQPVCRVLPAVLVVGPMGPAFVWARCRFLAAISRAV